MIKRTSRLMRKGDLCIVWFEILQMCMGSHSVGSGGETLGLKVHLLPNIV